MSLNIPGHGVGFHWGAIGGIIEGLIGTQEILSIREKTQTQAREFNDFNAHRARDSINTEQELHWNNAAASLNGNAFIIPSKNREQQNNALKKMKTKTSLSIINILHCYVFTINCVHKTIRRGHQSKAPVHVAGLCAVTCSLWTYRMCGLLLKMSTYQMTLGSLCQAPMRFLGVEKHTHTQTVTRCGLESSLLLFTWSESFHRGETGMCKGATTSVADRSHAASTMSLFHTVAVCVTLIHYTNGIPWTEEKVNIFKGSARVLGLNAPWYCLTVMCLNAERNLLLIWIH